MRLSASSFRVVVASCLGFAVFGAGTAHAGFVINPTYDSTILGNSDIKNTLDSVILLYQSTFTDNITVNITFNSMTTGLGQSSTAIKALTYTAYHDALVADSKTADDATALAKLAANPNSGNVVATKANWRALGLDVSTFEAGPDCTIGLNTSLCFYNHTNPVGSKYDLYAVACHEVDEALGTGSGVSSATPWASDLFRYDALGNRSFNTDTTIHTYFSLDGTTHIDEYNQIGRTGGDWGDWTKHSPGHVQDWQGTPGAIIDPNTEFRVLDAIGYDRTTVPEPASMAAFGIGLVAMMRRRRKG